MTNVGWFAACIATLFHGSFTVPMKGKAANSVNIDPFVFQTFKTFMCFSTSWIGPLRDNTLKFSPLGIPSAFLWVIGGTLGIFAVRNAGLAISVGIWSSVIVLVSYIWGVLIFEEPVESKVTTFISVLFLIIGLSGMTYSTSASLESKDSLNNDSNLIELAPDNINTVIDIGGGSSDESENGMDPFKTTTLEKRLIPSSTISPDNTPEVIKPIDSNAPTKGIDTIEIFGRSISRHYLGLMAAVGNGVFSGSSFIPMQFLSEDEKGLAFVFSFAVGAAIVTTSFWILRYFFQVYLTKSFKLGYKTLPSFHLKVMWLPGGCSGLLWSIGNVGNILAVSHLGQAIGLSLGQAAMIVSGLWGIFWYKEIVDPRKILIWFGSAFITCASISALCYEHVE